MPTVRKVSGLVKPNIATASFTLRGDEASAIIRDLPKLKKHLAEKWKVTEIKVTFRNPCYPDHTQFSLTVELLKDVTSTTVTLALTAMTLWVGKQVKNYRKMRAENRKTAKRKAPPTVSGGSPRKKR